MPEFKTSIDEVNQTISHVVQAMPTVSQHLLPIALGGDRIRCRLMWDLLDGDTHAPNDWVPAAAAIELLHLATLVHDDIVDNSDLRRGSTTIHKAVGLPQALWAGDKLIAEAVHLSVAVSPVGSRQLAWALAQISESQCIEALPDPDYWTVVDGKTGALFASAVTLSDEILGGRLPGNHVEAAMALGRLFQYVDDAQDIYGDTTELGKPMGIDAANGTNTLAADDAAVGDGAVAARVGELTAAVQAAAVEQLADPFAMTIRIILDRAAAVPGAEAVAAGPVG